MGRERTPLKRIKSKEVITININSLFRNPDIQKEVVINIKKINKEK